MQYGASHPLAGSGKYVAELSKSDAVNPVELNVVVPQGTVGRP